MSVTLSSCKKEEAPKEAFTVFIQGGNSNGGFDVYNSRTGEKANRGNVQDGYKMMANSGDVIYWNSYGSAQDTLRLIAADTSKNRVFFNQDIIVTANPPYPSGNFTIE